MHAYLETIVCKFGGDLAICLREEAICAKVYRRTDDGRISSFLEKWAKKGKGLLCPLVIAPHSRHGHLRGAQVHGAHQAASHIPALYLPSCNWYSFTDPERMKGWISPGPGCKEQLAHGCYATACGRRWGSNLRPRGRWSSTLATGLSRHPKKWFMYPYGSCLRYYQISPPI